MRYRKLRIAWSVAWGVVAVLLCVLWVRSYWICDEVAKVDGMGYFPTLGSNSGTVYYARSKISIFLSPDSPIYSQSWTYRCQDATKPQTLFRWSPNSEWYVSIYVPYWLPVLVTVAIAAGLWLPSRFSLRTLLIATTLVAVALGLIVWVSRAA
jgi:hypothetical protein